MASIPTSQPSRVFIDSSVLFAAALSSSSSARDLITLASRGAVRLVVSELVYQETARNLAAKAPAALPAFELFRTAEIAEITTPPPRRLILRVAEVIQPKDAPIVAAALHAHVDALASYDRKHLLAQAAPLQERFDLVVTRPDEILRQL